MTNASKLFTTIEAAERIGVKPNTLERWRTFGTGPEFIKINPRSLRSPIRYRESAIENWLSERTCTNTSQYPMSNGRVSLAVMNRGEKQ